MTLFSNQHVVIYMYPTTFHCVLLCKRFRGDVCRKWFTVLNWSWFRDWSTKAALSEMSSSLTAMDRRRVRTLWRCSSKTALQLTLVTLPISNLFVVGILLRRDSAGDDWCRNKTLIAADADPAALLRYCRHFRSVLGCSSAPDETETIALGQSLLHAVRQCSRTAPRCWLTVSINPL